MSGFNTKSTVKITGLTNRQVDYWDRIHFIKPSISEATGYGSVRLYSFIDLVQLKVVKKLREAGISLQKIRKSVAYLKKNFIQLENPLAELKFLTDGETIFVLTENQDKIIDTLKAGQLVMSISIGWLVQELKSSIIDIEKERKYSVTVNKQKFEVILHPDTEDGGYWVECPSLPGCASQGDTVEEALYMIKDAIEGHLEILEEDRAQETTKATA